MNKSICSDIIEPLKELIFQYDFFLKGYKEKNGVKTAAVLCDSLPFEILYSSGYVPLRIPSFMLTNDCCSFFDNKKSKFGDLYDLIIIPEGCCNKDYYKNQDSQVFLYKNPSGYADEFSNKMDQEICRLSEKFGEIDLKSLNKITEMYNVIRRQIRGISSERKSNLNLITYGDLNILFEACMILPPEIVNQYLNKIIERITNSHSQEGAGAEPLKKNPPIPSQAGGVEVNISSKQLINCFIYTSFIGNTDLFDEIENLGFNIFEDDSCGGRRQFDISVNAESENLYKEILHAYSFKPYCSSKRKVEERYELLYKLLKSHDAELVIFIEDLCCKSKKEQIDFLNIRLMRSGVDTIKITMSNAIDELRKYRENSLKKL